MMHFEISRKSSERLFFAGFGLQGHIAQQFTTSFLLKAALLSSDEANCKQLSYDDSVGKTLVSS